MNIKNVLLCALVLISCCVKVDAMDRKQQTKQTLRQNSQQCSVALASSIQKKHAIDEFSYFNTPPHIYLYSLGKKDKNSILPRPTSLKLLS